jgi:predicted metal-dependent phosphoesterase TrpH
MVDLHTHSNASDGDLSPEQLMREAKKRGVAMIALTDHDTLAGLEGAKNEAKAIEIHFIPGVEISINWKRIASAANFGPGPSDEVCGLGPGGEMHLLGLGIASPRPAFLSAISELTRRREERNREILDRMHEQGIEANWADIAAMAGTHSIGRPHFASYLVMKKIVRNREQAFARFLKPGKPLFVPKAGLGFEEASALIRESGGIPVLAHPMSLYVAWGSLPGLVKALKSRGLMGLDAWHPPAKANQCRRLEALGKELGLYITEGSDYHGSIRPDRQLGCSGKGREISDAIIEAIPELYNTFDKNKNNA